MASRRTAQPVPTARDTIGRRIGRPPSGRTALGKWLIAQGMTTRDLAEAIRRLARQRRVPEQLLLHEKTISAVVRGLHCPGPVMLLLIRDVTSRAVDLDQWSSEAISRT